MARIATVGDMVEAHDGCPSVPIITGDNYFRINGKPVAVTGSLCAAHSCKDHGTHQDVVIAGAPYFTVNGRHVARIGDKTDHGNAIISGVDSFTVGDCGGESVGIDNRFSAVKTCVLHYVDHEKVPFYRRIGLTVLALPEIAENEAEKADDPDMKWAWERLAPLLKKWLGSDPYNNLGEDIKANPAQVDFYEVDADWDLLLRNEKVKKVYDAFVGLTDEDNKKKAEENLRDVLKGMTELWEKGGDFDLTQVDDLRKYKKNYFNHMPVKEEASMTPAQILFGAFDIKALCAGSVKVNTDGSRTIRIDKLYAYIDDRFNFDVSTLPSLDFLGYWDKDTKSFSPSPFDGGIMMSNGVMNVFRKRYGKGGDFWVLSKARECPEFKPYSFDVP